MKRYNRKKNIAAEAASSSCGGHIWNVCGSVQFYCQRHIAGAAVLFYQHNIFAVQYGDFGDGDSLLYFSESARHAGGGPSGDAGRDDEKAAAYLQDMYRWDEHGFIGMSFSYCIRHAGWSSRRYDNSSVWSGNSYEICKQAFACGFRSFFRADSCTEG